MAAVLIARRRCLNDRLRNPGTESQRAKFGQLRPVDRAFPWSFRRPLRSNNGPLWSNWVRSATPSTAHVLARPVTFGPWLAGSLSGAVVLPFLDIHGLCFRLRQSDSQLKPPPPSISRLNPPGTPVLTLSRNYVFGPTTVGFAFSQTRLDYNDGSSRKFNNYDANLQYLLKPAVTLIGVYTFTDGRADGLTGLSGKQLKPRWHQFTLGLDYALSARTDLYLSGAYQLAAGDASTRVGSGYQKIAAIADVGTPSSTNRQVAVLGGLRVKF
ncbi:porin [Paraburkholderia sediminicola]